MTGSKSGGVYRACKFCSLCYDRSKKLTEYTDLAQELAAEELRDKSTQQALKALESSDEIKVDSRSSSYKTKSYEKSSDLMAACVKCDYTSPAIKKLAIDLGLVFGVEMQL